MSKKPLIRSPLVLEPAEVPTADIDSKDATYRITTADGIDELTASLTLVGLVNRPVLQRLRTGCCRIVSGFRRVAACRRLGWPAIPCRLVPLDASEQDCVHLAIAENSLQRPLNLIECSRALNLLAAVCANPEETIRRSAQLALPANPVLVEKIRRLEGMPPTVRQGVLSGGIALAMALELSRLGAASAEALARIMTELKLGLNRQRELLTLMREIAAREGVALENLLGDAAIARILQAPETERAARARQLAAYLKQRRYPVITQTQNRFERLQQELKLGPGVDLLPPKDFEGTTYTLSIRFDGLDQLRKRQRSLTALPDSDAFRAFMES
jgi:ParB family chromosome partitioning protein